MIKGFNLVSEQRDRTYVARFTGDIYVSEIPSVGDSYFDQDGAWTVTHVESRLLPDPPTLIVTVAMEWVK